MEKGNILDVGEKVDLTLDGKVFYKTVVGDVYENGLVMVGTPIHQGAYVNLQVFDEIYVVFYRDTGRYFVMMRVVDFQMRGGYHYTMLEQLEDPLKDQRREYYRLPISIEATLYEYSPDLEWSLSQGLDVEGVNRLSAAKTKDISATGIALITTKWECKLDEKYMLEMVFDQYPKILACARVIRSEFSPEKNVYNVGMRFFGMEKSKNDFLSKYILTQQQKRIVQKKLFETE